MAAVVVGCRYCSRDASEIFIRLLTESYKYMSNYENVSSLMCRRCYVNVKAFIRAKRK